MIIEAKLTLRSTNPMPTNFKKEDLTVVTVGGFAVGNYINYEINFDWNAYAGNTRMEDGHLVLEANLTDFDFELFQESNGKKCTLSALKEMMEMPIVELYHLVAVDEDQPIGMELVDFKITTTEGDSETEHIFEFSKRQIDVYNQEKRAALVIKELVSQSHKVRIWDKTIEENHTVEEIDSFIVEGLYNLTQKITEYANSLTEDDLDEELCERSADYFAADISHWIDVTDANDSSNFAFISPEIHLEVGQALIELYVVTNHFYGEAEKTMDVEPTLYEPYILHDFIKGIERTLLKETVTA